MNRITINGQTFEISGSNTNVRITNGGIHIGDNTIISGLSGNVNVKWEGDLANLQCDGNVTCNDVGTISAGGSVTCNNVSGNVSCGGSLKANGHIGKNIHAGGNVEIGD